MSACATSAVVTLSPSATAHALWDANASSAAVRLADHDTTAALGRVTSDSADVVDGLDFALFFELREAAEVADAAPAPSCPVVSLLDIHAMTTSQGRYSVDSHDRTCDTSVAVPLGIGNGSGNSKEGKR